MRCTYSFCMGKLVEVLLVLAAALAWISLTLIVIDLPATRRRNSKALPTEGSPPYLAEHDTTSTPQGSRSGGENTLKPGHDLKPRT